jgi:hypothetical protein
MRGPVRIAKGVARRVRNAVRPGGQTDLIHAVKNDIVNEIGVVKGQLGTIDAGNRSIQDQQAMAGTRIELLVSELATARTELGWAKNDILAVLERMAPLARAKLVHELRLADIDQPTADVLNELGSHKGPLAEVGLWRNDPVVVQWLAGDARVGAVNERIVEQPFVHGALAGLPVGSRIVDVGGGESLVGLGLASLGHQVTVIEPAGYPYEHPNLTVVEQTLDEYEPDGPVEAVILLSAIEHFGIGAYANNGELDADADLAAMKVVRDLLAPDGVVVLTTPFGPGAVNELERTYDLDRLRSLFDGFSVEHAIVASRQGATTWTVTATAASLDDGVATPEAPGHVAMVRARRTA